MTLATTSLHPSTRQLRRPLRLAVLDMAGTTVDEGGLQDEAFSSALAAQQVDPGSAQHRQMLAFFRDRRGFSRPEMFAALFPQDPERAHRANGVFEAEYDRLLDERGVAAMPGAEAAVRQLREMGLKICLTTGFARHTQNMILESLGWMSLADLSLCPSDAGRGVPYPDMILTAVLALDLEDVRSVLAVGDTTGDIGAGVRAGVGLSAGVLTGHQDRAALEAAGADVVVDSIAGIPALVAGRR